MKTTTCRNCGDPYEMYGGRLQCKRCRRARNTAWYEKNREKVALKQAQTLYGVSAEEALEMRAREGCDVCGSPPGDKSLHIDHDHETGKVRGVLCGDCNLTLGRMNDDPGRLRALADYLERNGK